MVMCFGVESAKSGVEMKMPKVSIGMPVYNSEQWISDSIESILAQTFDDLELVISDNASTDGTGDICREFSLRDKRVRYYRNDSNIGASDNYNAVFHYSVGEYFKWASSNDICKKTFLASCIEVLDERPDVVLCYPKTRLFDGDLSNAKDYEDDLHLIEESACARFSGIIDRMGLNNVMNGVMRSEVLQRTALIKTFFSSDVSLMSELALYGKFFEVPEYLFYRRMDEESATKLKSEEEVLKHYDPELKNPMLFQNWKINLEYIKAVSRAPLELSERACLAKRIFRQLLWSKGDLAKDFVQAWRSKFNY